MSTGLTRRELLGGLAAVGAGSLLAAPSSAQDRRRRRRSSVGSEEKAALNGRLKQSICFWCFNTAGEKWDAEKTCQVAQKLGCLSVELIEPASWDILKKYGLVCAMSPNGMP